MKHFLVILGLTVLVWLGVSMSDEHEYPMQVQVQFAGYDTVRYAVVRADTAVEVKARMEGFNALWGSLHHRNPSVRVVLPRGRRAVAMSEITDQLRRSIAGAKQVSSNTDSLRIVLAARASREYQPRLDAVDFTFTEQYGLCGEPQVQPATVVLYGPQEDLDRIETLPVAAATIRNVDRSGSYRLPLEPVWERFADVHPSVREVVVNVPVEAYVEKEYKVPVTVEGQDSTVTLRLYPEVATVRAWVPQRDIAREADIRVSIDYEEVINGNGQVSPRLVRFPVTMRPRSVEPREMQCVVIK